MELQDKVALVTGAGVRLGQAVAQQLAQLGMRVVIHYHHSENGQNKPFKVFQVESRDILFCKQI